MLNNIPDIFYNKNINSFVSKITKELTAAIEKYWEQDVDVNLLAINTFREIREEKLVAKTDFFSSLIKVEKHKPITIRLSKECIKSLFDSVLTFSADFKLSSLTSLEVRILNNFCEFLYKKLKEDLIPSKNLKLTSNSEKNVNFVFLAKLKDTISFKFMISIPLDRIKFDELNKETNFTDEDFLTSQTMVRIRAGKTKVTLVDLEGITESDIVLLEDSDITKLTLISGNYEQKFNVKTDPSLVMDIGSGKEEDIDIDNYEVTMEKNLWDDIQIEVSAEFEKVKMTIGELKQITQGQIVDLGSVFNNEISLFVENKKVAKGELIIINDRYAVRLNEVISKPKTAQPPKETPKEAPPKESTNKLQPKPNQAQAPKQPQAQPQPQPKPQPQPQPQAQEDEDFDYSDFEK